VFTVSLGAVAAQFACGHRYDLNGKARAVEPETDAVLDEVVARIDGPCPECGGDDGGETVAAE